MNRVKLVAEVGCNHQGREDLALEMASIALRAGADYVKFQKRNIPTLLSRDQYLQPHPVSNHSFGETYGMHREALELTVGQHRTLKQAIEAAGGRYACSVWDPVSAREIISLEPDYVKVPSACNGKRELLEVLCREYRGDIHVSLGMVTRGEIEAVMAFLETEKVLPRVVLYACTSAYPAKAAQVCLREIQWLKARFGEAINAVGFSGHHRGIAIDIGAATLGAQWIERHFTLDRHWKGRDQAFSLEPTAFSQLRCDLHDLHEALAFKPPGESLVDGVDHLWGIRGNFELPLA